MDNNSDDTNSVGYGKPPKDTQFKKGQSGNPKGRPKGSRNMAALILRALKAKVMINENGRRRQVTKFEAAIMQLVNKAAGGDLRATNQTTTLVVMAEQRDEQEQSRKPGFDDADKRVLAGLMERLEVGPEGGNEDEDPTARKDN